MLIIELKNKTQIDDYDYQAKKIFHHFEIPLILSSSINIVLM